MLPIIIVFAAKIGDKVISSSKFDLFQVEGEWGTSTARREIQTLLNFFQRFRSFPISCSWVSWSVTIGPNDHKQRWWFANKKKERKKKMIMMTIQREGQRFSEVVPEFEESGITEQKRWTEQWRQLSFGNNHPLKSLQWRPFYFEDIIPWIKTRSTTTMTSCTQARSDPRRPWRRVEWNDINW